MQVYKSKCGKTAGTSYSEVYPRALTIYKQIQAHTKRHPYVRSRYLSKDKVFLAYFWQHFRQKNFKDRARRLRFFEAALDVFRNTKQSPTEDNEVLHRFAGTTKDDELFYIQVKENKKTGHKDFISVFPPN